MTKKKKKKSGILKKVLLFILILLLGFAGFIGYRTYANGGGMQGLLSTLVGNDEKTLEQLEPIRGVNPDKLPKEKIEEYEQIASKIIKQNKFAVATMAGGQGTRLRTPTSKRYIQNRYRRKWKILI